MAVENYNHLVDATRWKWYKTCTCGGVLKHKYRHLQQPLKELHLLPTRGKYRLLEGSRLTEEAPLEKLSERLKEID
ncbi:MAG: hypothetical protein U0T75_10350 [Chitinophagales bacterium]